MQPHELRVVEEKRELDARISKLGPFLKTEMYNQLPEAEKDRLFRQHGLMNLYSTILSERIAAFPV